MFKRIMKIFRPKWEIIYTTQNQEKYFKVKGKLVDNHIEHKTAFDASAINRSGDFNRPPRTYTVLVRVEEVYKANNLIHEIRH